MLYKIVGGETEGEKFKIKEVDADGNSLGLIPEEFDTHNDATAWIKAKTEGGEISGDTKKKCATEGCETEVGEDTEMCLPHTPVDTSVGTKSEIGTQTIPANVKTYTVIGFAENEGDEKSITLVDGTKFLEGEEVALDPEGDEAKGLLEGGYIVEKE